MNEQEKQAADKYKIGKEKMEWLKEVEAAEIKEPYIYYVFNKNKGFPSEFYSEKYLKETPLEELKKNFDSYVRSDEWND